MDKTSKGGGRQRGRHMAHRAGLFGEDGAAIVGNSFPFSILNA